MSKLREKMINDLVVRGRAKRTQEAYVAAVIGLVKYYRRSPDRITDVEVQAYLASVVRERGLRPHLTVKGCALARRMRPSSLHGG